MDFNRSPCILQCLFTYLIDTGATSVIPPPRCNMKEDNRQLYAANGTKIETFGTENLTLFLSLRCKFCWTFIVADVLYPIIGADFLQEFGLLPDLQNWRIIDSLTKFTTNCSLQRVHHSTISVVNQNEEFSKILEKYPAVTNPQRRVSKFPHHTQHVIKTNGQPVVIKACPQRN